MFILLFAVSQITSADAKSYVVLHTYEKAYFAAKTTEYQTAVEEMGYIYQLKLNKDIETQFEDVIEPHSVYISTLEDTKHRLTFIEKGYTNLHNIPANVEAYEIFDYKGTIVLLGSSPRAMLNAVYEYQEMLMAGFQLYTGFRYERILNPKMRIFHCRFAPWPGERHDVRYIAHLGATHCLLTHDWQGDLRRFQGYVKGDLFPDAIEESQRKSNHQKLRSLIDDCKDYGLEASLWITELPCQGGPWTPEHLRQRFLEIYPDEVLSLSGTYQGKVLCFGHPKIQEYYAQLMQRFFTDFPEIKLLFVFGLDANGEFCDPETCPRCKGMSKFDQRDRFLRFLIEEGQKTQPELKVLTTNWGWEMRDIPGFMERQKKMPADCGVFFAAQYDAWQSERQVHDFMLETRKICEENGQLFIGYDNLHWGDDSLHNIKDIQDFPLGIGAKLRRWEVLEVDGVFDHWGMWSENIWSNSIACREFFINPYTDPTEVAKKIALRQFGPRAGNHVLDAWKQIEHAHRIQSNTCIWPPQQWIGWYAHRATAPIPEEFRKVRIGGGLRAKKATHYTYNDGSLQQKLSAVSRTWEDSLPYYQSAMDSLDKAIEIAGDGPLFYRYWYNGPEKVPNRTEHLRMQRLYYESVSTMYREIGLHFRIQSIYEQYPDDAEKFRQAAIPWLKKDLQACKDCLALMQQIMEKKLYRHEYHFEIWLKDYPKKIKQIEEYLAEK